MHWIMVVALASAVSVFSAPSEAQRQNGGEKHSKPRFNLNQVNPPDWYGYWKRNMPSSLPWGKLTDTDEADIKRVSYYVKVNNIDLGIINSGNDRGIDNVRRVMKIMPKENFERIFPYTMNSNPKSGVNTAKAYSYDNFLRAVAALPAYCGDYSGMDEKQRTPAMAFPDMVCKRMLATTFAHAVQETSDVNRQAKIEAIIKGTFASVTENNWRPSDSSMSGALPYFDGTGPYADKGAFANDVRGRYYYGRGAKQLSYPSNYAMISYMTFGDDRLVKNPDLVASDSFLPFYTALAYALIPKDGRPSIAEVMDGTLKMRIEALRTTTGTSVLANNQTVDNETLARALEFYDRGFSLSIALVNGGPECANVEKNRINTQVRIDAFAYFITKNGADGLFDLKLSADEQSIEDKLLAKDVEGCDVPMREDLTAPPFSLKPVGLDTASDGNPLWAGRRLLNIETDRNSGYVGKVVRYAGGMPIFGGKPLHHKILSINQFR